MGYERETTVEQGVEALSNPSTSKSAELEAAEDETAKAALCTG